MARPGKVPMSETSRDSTRGRHPAGGGGQGRPTKRFQLKPPNDAEGPASNPGRSGQLEKPDRIHPAARKAGGNRRQPVEDSGSNRASRGGLQQPGTAQSQKRQERRKPGGPPPRVVNRETGTDPSSRLPPSVPRVRESGYTGQPSSPGPPRHANGTSGSAASASRGQPTIPPPQGAKRGQYDLRTTATRQSRSEPLPGEARTHGTPGARHSEANSTPNGHASSSGRGRPLPRAAEKTAPSAPLQDGHSPSILELGIPDARALADMLWQRRAAADTEKLKTASKKGETQENVFYARLERIKDHQWQLRERNEAKARERVEMLESTVKLTRPLDRNDERIPPMSTRERKGRKGSSGSRAGAGIGGQVRTGCRSAGITTRCRESVLPENHTRTSNKGSKPRKVSWAPAPSKRKQRLAAAALLGESDDIGATDRTEDAQLVSRRGAGINHPQVARWGTAKQNGQKELGRAPGPRSPQAPRRNARRTRREQAASSEATTLLHALSDAGRAVSGSQEFLHTGENNPQNSSSDTGSDMQHFLSDRQGHCRGACFEGQSGPLSQVGRTVGSPPHIRNLHAKAAESELTRRARRGPVQEGLRERALLRGLRPDCLALSNRGPAGGDHTVKPACGRGTDSPDSFRTGKVPSQVLSRTGRAVHVPRSSGASRLPSQRSEDPAGAGPSRQLSSLYTSAEKRDVGEPFRGSSLIDQPVGAAAITSESSSHGSRPTATRPHMNRQSALFYDRGAFPPKGKSLLEKELKVSVAEIRPKRLRSSVFAAPHSSVETGSTPVSAPMGSPDTGGPKLASMTGSLLKATVQEDEIKEARQGPSKTTQNGPNATGANSFPPLGRGSSPAVEEDQQGQRRLQFTGKSVIDQATPARFEFVDNDHGMQFVNWRSFTGERVIEKFWQNSLRESEARDRKRVEQEVQTKFAEEFEFERRKKQLWEAMGRQPPEDNTSEQELADRYYSAMQAVLHGPKEDILTGQAFGRYALSSNDKFIKDLRNRVIYGPWALNWNRAITSRTTRVSLGGRRGAVSVGSSASSYVTTANVNWNRTAVTFAVRPNDQAVKLGVLRGRYGVDIARSNRLRTSAVETVMRYVETATVVDQINRTYGQRVRIRRFSFNYTRDFTIPRFDSPGRTPGLRQELAVNWGSLGISVGTDVPDNEYAISVGLRGYQFSVLRDFFQRLTQFQGNWGRGWQLEIATKFEDPVSQLIYYQVGFGRLGRLYATAGAGVGSEGTPMALVQVQGNDASVAFKAVEEAGVRIFNIGFTVGRFTYSWDSVVDYNKIALPLSPINAVLKTLLEVTP
ncbi:hypothetical protein CSUI_000903 [Cystoisospora suis]|uniref:Uncharacterized protein n=1 Tax=Cystoisospora suis TaxID=483139 RepID=A0A2C6LES3_9APIC|nr:hypothetical protein CSUI_000903 [Cystoisospora suis]